jgi:hypothetical protein
VLGWHGPARTVTGSIQLGSGAPACADPRPFDMESRALLIIRALDGTWHRPMTVLERAALQGLVEPETVLEFLEAVNGASATAVSEWVGNAIPPPAMAESLRAAGVAILLSRAGETWAFGSTPAWCKPFARAVLMPSGGVS